VLDVAGLAGHPDERADRLPMGLRQRLALGCALVHGPRVLFLDEPTAGVDVLGRRKLWDILFHLSRDCGVAILVTTHYMSEAEHCDQLALMHAGRIVASGTPTQMKRSVEESTGRVLEIDTSNARLGAHVLREANFNGVALHGSHVHVFSRQPEEDALRVELLLRSSGLELRGAHERGVTMEDVFVSRIMALEIAERAGPRPAAGAA
jgi:ABC-2 type transport system ATP-binding protein